MFDLLKRYSSQLFYLILAIAVIFVIWWTVGMAKRWVDLERLVVKLQYEIELNEAQTQGKQASDGASLDSQTRFVQSIGERHQQFQTIKEQADRDPEHQVIDQIWKIYCVGQTSPVCKSLEVHRED